MLALEAAVRINDGLAVVVFAVEFDAFHPVMVAIALRANAARWRLGILGRAVRPLRRRR